MQSKACLVDGELLDRLKTMPSDRFDAMLTDPPYGIGFMGKEWDTPGSFVERKPVRANTWDKVGGNHNPTGPLDRSRTRLSENAKYQVFMTAWAVEALRVLKPGAFALVFGGTRTFHRLAVALEDAGFEMRDTLMWVYGQGFPKSQDISKAIDKAAGAERGVIAVHPNPARTLGNERTMSGGQAQLSVMLTAPATAEAQRWQGYGTALKPAWEPILLVRKPTALTFAQNALEHECGALNIDGARVTAGDPFGGGRKATSGFVSGYEHDGWQPGSEHGRWPANLIHDGSDEVVGLFPQTAGGSYPAKRSKDKDRNAYGEFAGQSDLPQAKTSAGSAARFFYTAKASRSERDAGIEGGNQHPTVKPLALTEYLAKLLLPPSGATRRLFVPFAGSGSEIIGALQAGWEWAIGVELETAYHDIAQARIEHRGFVVDRRHLT